MIIHDPRETGLVGQIEQMEKQLQKYVQGNYLSVMGSQSWDENGSFVHILLDINLTFLKVKHKFRYLFYGQKGFIKIIVE